MKSPKELSVDKKITSAIEELIQLTPEKDPLPLKVAEALMSDAEIESIKNIVYTTGNPVMIESVKELLED